MKNLWIVAVLGLVSFGGTKFFTSIKALIIGTYPVHLHKFPDKYLSIFS